MHVSKYHLLYSYLQHNTTLLVGNFSIVAIYIKIANLVAIPDIIRGDYEYAYFQAK